MDILRGYRVEVNYDLYVSPGGNDNNTGLSPSQAMKTITKAVHRIAADSLNIKTVHLLPGTYIEGENEQILPIPVKSNTNIIGAGSDQVTIYSDVLCAFGQPKFIGVRKCKNTIIRGFSIAEGVASNRIAILNTNTHTNLQLTDIVIQNMSVCKLGAIFFYQLFNGVIDSVVMRNINTPESAMQIVQIYDGTIRNSTFEYIHSTYTSPDTPGDDSWSMAVMNFWVWGSFKVENCTFRNISVQNNQFTFHISSGSNPETVVDVSVNNNLFDNIRSNSARAIGFAKNVAGNYRVSNNTFYNNFGAVSAVNVIGNIQMRNNIFVNPNCPNEINMSPVWFQGPLTVLDFDYNNIRGGFSGIYNPDHRNTLIYGSNNTSADPMFAGTTAG
ncbi:MAG: hypothetical protein Q8J62_00005, partial [Candidatus Cloacimonadaceae bacterium]|nr:hypothetical protein [Candidatus Cloacimonadaceae bacterium]